MFIPVWLLVLLIVTNFFSLMFIFFFIYLICGIHDLYFVRYRKENNSKKEAPYFIEKDLPKE